MKRDIFHTVMGRLTDNPNFIQVLSGPRQVGKTTIAQQVIAAFNGACHFCTADEPSMKNTAWLTEQWQAARFKVQSNSKTAGLLVIDEIQKLSNWSETVKRLWDEDRQQTRALNVLILGSAPLLMQKGLTESLTGRFEIIEAPHWRYLEINAAFNWTLDQYIFYGGYPGACSLIDDYPRWANYITNSLIETTIAKDILMLTRVDKPALLRQLFHLGCTYSGQILSFQKIMGQLQDAGNTTTLSHYLELLGYAGMLSGIPKYAGEVVRRRASSPKLQVLNTGLMSAQYGNDLAVAKKDPIFWGRLVESAVGAHLLSAIKGKNINIYYWREGNFEVDFILERAKKLVAFEVKSNSKHTALPGMEKFNSLYAHCNMYLIGGQGIDLQTFFSTPIESWFDI